MTDNKDDKNQNKNMNIDDLVNDLEPVKPMISRSLAALIFILLGYGIVFMIAFKIGFRHDIGMIFSMPKVLLQVTALFIAGLLAVFATFRLSCPQEEIDITTKSMITISILLITAVIFYCAGMGSPEEAQKLISKGLAYVRVKNVLLVSLAPLILMFIMMRKARPVHTSLIGLTSALAVSAMSVTACKMTCNIESLHANLLWHYGPIVVIALIGFLVGKYVYKWK